MKLFVFIIICFFITGCANVSLPPNSIAECKSLSGTIRSSSSITGAYICDIPGGSSYFMSNNKTKTSTDQSKENNVLQKTEKIQSVKTNDSESANNLQKAIEAHTLENYKFAYEQFIFFANHNNAEAQYYLALMYANAQYVSKDMISAYAWSKLSAQNGFSKAQVFNDVVKKLLSFDEKNKGDLKVDELKRLFTKDADLTPNIIHPTIDYPKGGSIKSKEECSQYKGISSWNSRINQSSCQIGNRIYYYER